LIEVMVRGKRQKSCGARGRFLGTVSIADTVRPEAKDAIQSLKSMGLRTVLLTGDAKSVADDVGRKLGIDEIVSDLLPEGKLQYVKNLAQKGHNTAMVGDGVNDAPALMQASVGVAMGSGTDVARESADVVLIGSDLSKLVETLRTARALPSDHHAEFRGNIGSGQHRCWPGSIRISQSFAGCIYSRFVRDGFILNSRQIASTRLIGKSICSRHSRTLTLANQRWEQGAGRRV